VRRPCLDWDHPSTPNVVRIGIQEITFPQSPLAPRDDLTGAHPHLVGAQSCRLSHVDAPTVALKPVMGKYLDIVHNIVLWHFATCTSVNTERSICANCGGGKLAQTAKDGQRDTMHNTLCYTITM